MKVERLVIALSIVFGVGTWILDTLADMYFYHRTFWGLLFGYAAPQEIPARLIAAAGVLSFGILTAGAMANYRSNQEARRDSEERFRQIIEQMPDPVGVCAPDGQVVLVNPAFLRVFGLPSAESVVGKFNILGDPAVARWGLQDAVQQVYRGQPVVVPAFSVQFGQRTALLETTTREAVTLEVTMFPVLRQTGEIHQVVTIWQDVTAHWRAEEEVRWRAEALAALHETAVDLAAQQALPDLLQAILRRACGLLQADGGCVYLYRPAVDALELAIQHKLPVSTGIFLQRGEGLSGRVLETGRSMVVDDYSSWADRSHQYDQVTFNACVGVPISWSGRLLGVLVLTDQSPRTFSPADIALLERFTPLAAAALENARLLETERRRTAELEALRQASLRLTSSLELQPVLEAILEHALQLIAADDAHIFLYDQEKLTFGAALYADGRPSNEPRSAPRMYGLTYTVAHTAERIVISDVNSHPLFEKYHWGGAIIGMPLCIGQRVVGVMNVAMLSPHNFDEEELRVLGLLADQAAIAIENARLYSDLQQEMDKFKKAQAHLVQSARLAAVGELAAGVAHELNNPLTSIMGFAELLAEDALPGSDARRDLGTIAGEAKRARDIVRRLLDFSRQARLEKRPVDVNHVLQETLSLNRLRLEKGGIVVEEAYGKQVAPVKADEGQLKQVFLNLINNAAQAMSAGGVLRIETSQVNDEVMAAISDQGEGIRPEVQGRLFEPFFTTKPTGMGLGLSVSLGIVQEHGGRITVESQLGHGSIFSVWLPALPAVDSVAG